MIKNNYEKYVHENKLISPINGHSCKSLVNNKSTIKKFGFNSIEDLHKQYPNFPLRCISSQIKFDNQTKTAVLKNKLKKTEYIKNNYNNNKTHCKHCNNSLPYEKRMNYFCSRKCSASFNSKSRIISEEQKLKTSKTLTGRKRTNIMTHNKSLITFLNCKICDSSFYIRGHSKWNYRMTCSTECRTKNMMNKRTYQNGKRKTIYYFNKLQNKEVILESSWELTIAKLLDENNINWIRPEPIKWIDTNNKDHLYYPDFYLTDYDLYLDPKNPYCMEKDKEKINYVSNKINLICGNVNTISNKILNL